MILSLINSMLSFFKKKLVYRSAILDSIKLDTFSDKERSEKRKRNAHPDYVIVGRSAESQRGCGRTRSAAKVSVVTARMKDPVAPADILEVNIELVPAALFHFR